MAQAWDSTRVLDSGKVCTLDHRFEAGFGAHSFVQCKIVYISLIRVLCVGLIHVLNNLSAVVGQPKLYSPKSKNYDALNCVIFPSHHLVLRFEEMNCVQADDMTLAWR